MAISLNNLGNIALLQGRPEEARRLIEEAVAAHREVGDPSMVASSLDNLGNATRELGEHAAAKALYDEALAIGFELGDLWLVAYVLEDVAILLARLDTPVEALTLAGAAARLRRELGSPRPPASQAELDRELERSRSALGPEGASRATTAGDALDAEQAAAHAAGVSV
jgi:tetratricopeptide (TPR) repeat protein